MRNVTIFGNFTILESFLHNSVQVDKGFDERLDIFYRVNFCIVDNDDIDTAYADYYYKKIDDLEEDLKMFNLE